MPISQNPIHCADAELTAAAIYLDAAPNIEAADLRIADAYPGLTQEARDLLWLTGFERLYEMLHELPGGQRADAARHEISLGLAGEHRGGR